MKIEEGRAKLAELEAIVSEKKATLSNRKYGQFIERDPIYAQYCSLKRSIEKYDREQAAKKAASTPWGENEPATEKQISYLVKLGVNITGHSITKAEASRLIDAAKSGDGVGFMGYGMNDGSC